MIKKTDYETLIIEEKREIAEAIANQDAPNYFKLCNRYGFEAEDPVLYEKGRPNHITLPKNSPQSSSMDPNKIREFLQRAGALISPRLFQNLDEKRGLLEEYALYNPEELNKADKYSLESMFEARIRDSERKLNLLKNNSF